LKLGFNPKGIGVKVIDEERLSAGFLTGGSVRI
jgi:hypothetical protein